MRVVGSLAAQGVGDTEAPSQPQGLNATAINRQRIDLVWQASTDNVGVTGYQIFRDGSPLDTTAGIAYSDTTGQPSTTYTYAVVAFDAAGNNSVASASDQATTFANASPSWAAVPDQSLIVGDSYLLNLLNFCTDADADTIQFAVQAGTLPTGVTLSGNNISGTPSVAGQTPAVTIRATDPFGFVDKVINFATFNADVTAPPVPTGLNATAQSSSSIALTWNASVDVIGGADEFVSGTQDYRVYRSTDGTNFALRTTVSTLSHTDTGLSASTQYFYTVAARDAELNESAQSSQAQATTQAGGALAWQTTIPTQTSPPFRNVAYSLDLDTLCTGAVQYQVLSGSLPTGTSLDGATGVISGTPTTEQTVSPTFRAFDAASWAAEQDWIARSTTGPGTLTMRTRFDTSGEVMDYRLLDSKAGNFVWDSTRKCSGIASMKINIPTTDTENSGNWFRHLDDAWGLYTGSGGQSGGSGNATNQGFNAGSVFEVSYRIYVPAALRNTLFPGGDGWKTSIFSHDRGSNQSFEVVTQNGVNRGFVQGYTQNPPNTEPWEIPANTLCSPTDFRFQPAIDRGVDALINVSPTKPGGGVWSDCEKTWARYGGSYSYGNTGYPDAIPGTRIWKFWEQLGTPANPLGPILYPADDWLALKCRVEINSYSASTNRVRWWAGNRTHTSWQLIADLQNRLLPTEDNGGGYLIRYNTLWLPMFNTNRTSGGGVTTFINYDEVIVKSGAAADIAFPTFWP